MLKLGCTLPNLSNICLHKSTNAKLYSFTENDKDLLEKDMRRYGLWSVDCIYEKSCCERDAYPGFSKRLQVSFIPSQCVKKCLLVFKRDKISIQSLVDSDPARTRRGALRTW